MQRHNLLHHVVLHTYIALLLTPHFFIRIHKSTTLCLYFSLGYLLLLSHHHSQLQSHIILPTLLYPKKIIAGDAFSPPTIIIMLYYFFSTPLIPRYVTFIPSLIKHVGELLPSEKTAVTYCRIRTSIPLHTFLYIH